MKSQIGYDIEFEEISTIENTLNWRLMLRFMLDVFYKKSRFRKTIVVAITLLLATSVLSGCAGDSKDPLVGTWYNDDDMAGMQMVAGGSWVNLEEGVATAEEGIETSWVAEGDKVTLTMLWSFIDGIFICDNGEEVDGSWVNDGEEDCADGSDEGVDTSDMEMDSMVITFTYRFEIVGDVMFFGTISMGMVSSDQEFSETVDEEALCSSDNSDCDAYVRASALSNVLFDTAVGGVEAPEWWTRTDT